jgi:GT2 family glycosyltransferase
VTEAAPQPYRLVPEQDVVRGDKYDIATSESPWLRIEPAEAIVRQRWIRIRYRSSLFDDPVRPLLRFRTSRGETIRVMSGPVAGTAAWIDRVPDATTSISISPTNRRGPFSFRLDGIQSLSRSQILLAALRRDPLRALRAVGLGLINERPEAEYDLMQALGTEPLDAYADWLAVRSRPLDPSDLDRPRTDWTRGPAVHLTMALDGATAAAVDATVRSLRAQAYPRWSLQAVVTSQAPQALIDHYQEHMRTEPRCLLVRPERDAHDASSTANANDWIGVIDAGDVLQAHALAVLIEMAGQNPHWSIVYADEDAAGQDGRPRNPRLKPDYSPELQFTTGYIGRPLFLRAGLLQTTGPRLIELPASEAEVLVRCLQSTDVRSVGHVRRLLYRRAADRAASAPPTVLRSPQQPQAAQAPDRPSVAIIIPTRNRAALLRDCLDGLVHRTDYPHLHIIIVDNGSNEADALALLEGLRGKPRYAVLERAGAFNFSALCNDGAAIAAARVLVFLNNDVTMPRPDWLEPLVRWAVRPDIGAVGAKLLFPDGRLQHAGAVLGLHGHAGHPYHGAAGDERGYLGELRHPHAVAAVMGACLAVERWKFNAVGGFDAQNLPVLLNDTDLCLRLAARGWKTIWTPESVLCHWQSGTRGHDHIRSERNRKDREFFMQRWAHVVRDDPYFHPALSLLSHAIGLAR